MGKGDKKTRRGKIARGSYGKHRPRRRARSSGQTAPPAKRGRRG